MIILAITIVSYLVYISTWAAICYFLEWSQDIWSLGTLLFWVIPLVIVVKNDQPWLIKLACAFSHKRRPVKLLDGENEVVYTVAKKTATGKWHCPVHWTTNVGNCILNDDGTVDRDSECSYILYWRPLRKTELMMHLFLENHDAWAYHDAWSKGVSQPNRK